MFWGWNRVYLGEMIYIYIFKFSRFEPKSLMPRSRYNSQTHSRGLRLTEPEKIVIRKSLWEFFLYVVFWRFGVLR